MKRKNILWGTFAAAGLISLAACQKNTVSKLANDRSLSTTGVTAACDCAAVATADSTISGTISSDLTLSNTKRYFLSGLVFVTGTNTTLTIQAGTHILGLPGASGVPGGGLVITRNNNIIAEGTSSCPIVFTTANEANPQPGQWAGVIILGNAPTNNYPATVEGINATNFPSIDLFYGATAPDAADNSGVLKFVRIEYAGFELGTDNEINGLTLAGVGSGTTIDYVEVYKANDDAFEFFGGTVNASHLIAVDALDDMFDTDNGYQGTISYALGLSDASRPDKSQSNGFESDNNAGGLYPSAGGPSGTGRFGRAAQLRRGAEFSISNAIFMGFNYGISLDSALASPSTRDKYYSGISTISNTFAHAFSTAATPAVGPFATESNGLAYDGTRFNNATQFLSYATVTPGGNFGVISTTANALGLVDPFNRVSDGAVNFMTNLDTPADNAGAGAFPDGVDWTIVNGCYNWTRY